MQLISSTSNLASFIDISQPAEPLLSGHQTISQGCTFDWEIVRGSKLPTSYNLLYPGSQPHFSWLPPLCPFVIAKYYVLLCNFFPISPAFCKPWESHFFVFPLPVQFLPPTLPRSQLPLPQLHYEFDCTPPPLPPPPPHFLSCDAS